MAIGPLDDEWEYGWNPQTGRTLSDAMASEGIQWGNDGFLASPLSGTFTGGGTGLAGAAGGIGNAIGNVKNALSDSVGTNWFGKSGILPTAFQGLSALGGLMQAYTGFKQLELGREQLRTAKNAFRTQWQNNIESLGKSAENAGKTNYALHHGLEGSFNSTDQVAEGNRAKNNATSGYKNYV